jgi:hypothetical protein
LLHIAAANGKKKIVKELLRRVAAGEGFDVLARNHRGKNALECAQASNFSELAEYLLEKHPELAIAREEDAVPPGVRDTEAAVSAEGASPSAMDVAEEAGEAGSEKSAEQRSGGTEAEAAARAEVGGDDDGQALDDTGTGAGGESSAAHKTAQEEVAADAAGPRAAPEALPLGAESQGEADGEGGAGQAQASTASTPADEGGAGGEGAAADKAGVVEEAVEDLALDSSVVEAVEELPLSGRTQPGAIDASKVGEEDVASMPVTPPKASAAATGAAESGAGMDDGIVEELMEDLPEQQPVEMTSN